MAITRIKRPAATRAKPADPEVGVGREGHHKFSAPSLVRRSDWPGLGIGLMIAAGAIAAYAHTFSVPLLFDDKPSIVDDPAIRNLGTALWPSVYSTAFGRPVLSLSLAINYAVSGTDPWSYHAVNLAIHILAGLALFGVVRRTLAPRYRPSAAVLAFSVALLWTLHPLQTESVTYVIQRAESLMGLFYLFTLYCFIRGAGTGGRNRHLWFVLCVASCAAGMATKEVMASAPLVLLLYDRTFVGGGFHEALRRRKALYAALASTWLILFLLVLSTHGRNGIVGFDTGVTWPRYALTQVPAVAHYLRLCFWPHPLIFDYGMAFSNPSFRLLPSAILVVGLMAATLWALVKMPGVGFLGASFFAILGPSSSIIPIASEPMAEHRMYLPLISVVTLAVLGIHRRLRSATLFICLALAACLGFATARRNRVYASEEAIWSATVSSRPENYRAHNNLGNALSNLPGRLDDAIVQFEEALRLDPDYAAAHYNLGNALSNKAGRLDEAIVQYEKALRLKPDYAEAHNNLGNAFLHVPGRLDDAITQYQETLRVNPDYVDAHYNLGNALLGKPGRLDEAIAQFEEALRVKPGYAEAHNNLGIALSSKPGRLDDAIAQFEEALRLKPGYAEAHNNLGNALSDKPGRIDDAMTQYEEALRLDPGYVDAHYNLGNALLGKSGRLDDAIAQFGEALRLKPDYAEAHFSLAVALLHVPGRRDEAKAQLEMGLQLRPDNAQARQILESLQVQAPEN
jgi:tetratricopeptide (TPR) repeat protein